ncbi:MAG: hypothetical protein ABSB35_21880 [Bryobacteraceae bacterium]|jgi:hypothetical protein
MLRHREFPHIQKIAVDRRLEKIEMRASITIDSLPDLGTHPTGFR